MAFPAKKTAAGKTAAPKKPAIKVPRPVIPKLTAAQKAKLLLFKAPTDFKPFYMELTFQTMKDGMIAPTPFRAQRIRGNWDNPDAKRFNMMEYDAATVMALVSRFAAACHSTNPMRRLPAKKTYGMFLRVTKKANGALNVAVKTGYELTEGSNGKPKRVWFPERKDLTSDKAKATWKYDYPAYEKMKRAVRLLRGAFVDVQLPPTPVRGKAKKDEEAEE